MISLIKLSWFFSFLLVTIRKVTYRFAEKNRLLLYSTVNTVYSTFIMIFDASVLLISGEGKQLLDSIIILVKGEGKALRIQGRNATKIPPNRILRNIRAGVGVRGILCASPSRGTAARGIPYHCFSPFVFCLVYCNIPCQFTPFLIRAVSFFV